MRASEARERPGLRAGGLARRFAILLALCAPSGLEAQSFDFLPAAFLEPGADFGLVEKTSFHRYVDGKNAGFVYRESRSNLSARYPSGARPAGLGPAYEGELLVLEEVYRDAGMSSRKVERSGAIGLGLGAAVSFSPDRGFPSLRGLLAAAPPKLEAGASWTAPASIALDPNNSGQFLVLPVLVEYVVSGPGSYAGREVLVVKGKFALRAGDYSGRPLSAQKGSPFPEAFGSVSGSHDLEIYVDAAGGGVLFIRDRFDEVFGFAGGHGERHSGFTLVFLKGGGLDGRARLAASLGAAPSPSASPAQPASPPPASPAPAAEPAPTAAPQRPDVSLSSAGPAPFLAGQEIALDESSPLAKAGVDLVDGAQGLVLRVRDLRFAADSDEVLASEKWRLDAIAASLSGVKEGSFLVEGHSAAVGKPKGELELSALRAKRVVDELVSRGLAAGRFIYRGLGSGSPIADNSTEEGRAENRRVEITILN